MTRSKNTLLLGIGSALLVALLIALLLFTLIPTRLETAHAAPTLPRPSAVTFANNNWNCVTAACTSTVNAGAAQNDYQCAEFVSRSLAFAEYVPGLGSLSAQSAYKNYNPHLGNGRIYDLLAITPEISPTGYGLQEYLLNSGFGTKIGTNLSEAVTGDVVVFLGPVKGVSGIVPAHTGIIVVKGSSTSTTLLDLHNNARYKYPLSTEAGGFKGWYIIHIS
ncbi:MAG: hypothetical protein ACLQUY_10815 [Ktedonobacterales bacterium]